MSTRCVKTNGFGFTSSVWLISAAALFGFGLMGTKVNAQTIYPFETSYDTEVTLIPIPATDVSQAFISGYNPDAPYGLTNFKSINNYSRFDPAFNQLVFVQDASKFGLQGFPIGGEEFSGSGDDKLFGNSTATASFDFINRKLTGTGIVNITGGSGRFSGAMGKLNFFETEPLDEDPTAPLKGKTFLTGSFQVSKNIPEPGNNIGLFGVAMVAVGLRCRTIKKNLDSQF